MTRTDYIVNGVLIRYAHTPPFSAKAAAERQAMRAEIAQQKVMLEGLRVREVELRAELVRELEKLAFAVKRAAFKISTRQWEDGNPALDFDIERMHQAAEALTDCVDDIAHTASMIEDQQNDLDDSALWQEEKQA
jgi:hypothetical protein